MKSVDMVSLSPEDAVKALKLYSQESLISEEKILSLYSVFGVDLFFLLFLMGGRSVTFLKQERLLQICDSCIIKKKKSVVTGLPQEMGNATTD